jgi:alpha-glucosidase (family GH31 glycosyl hydrolase)
MLTGMLALLQTTQAAVQRVKFLQSGTNNYLVVEFLKDELLHFELSGMGPGPDAGKPIFITPQVAKTDYAGPSSFAQSGKGGNTLDTTDMKVVVNTDDLCMTVTDKTKNLELTTICPLNLSQASKGLTIAADGMQHVYGLGEQFIAPAGNPDGDWTGRARTPGDNFGNQMVGFNGGANGNAQFPVMYAVGANNANYALFLDHIYKQRWDFTVSPWQVETLGDPICGYLMTGLDLPALRQDFMELTGHPPVPPKKMFGLWVSEYGYDDWGELEKKLNGLRSDKFPVDGFVLDLQWFGGITSGSDNSNMGRVSWDPTHFPDAANKLATYKDKEGIGIITIEESYISKALPEHTDLQERGYLIRAGCPLCQPVYLTANPWWGKGGMIDWTQDAAGDYWHDLKRQPLIKDGVIGHWIDLGEPEMYDPKDWVAGVLPDRHGQADYHNMYNFKWAQSIARGYARNNETRRPFMMARSGAAGIQRFGASMWSGDIGSDLANLRTHFNAQMHMSMSGIDYFGADIGGFHRQGGDPTNMYTEWFANGMMFDVPGRPHTENLCNCKETAPDRIGDKASNLANVRQRYELSPYLYSLAHLAYLKGEPVVPPLVYYYQNDMNVREMGNEKLLGRDLLVAADADQNAARRDVYLPASDWVSYHTDEWFHSTGQTFTGQSVLQDGIFRLPTYARAGAIIPKMYVDDKTMNILGKRTDGSNRNELIVRVYAAKLPSDFTLYEDDGETIAYQNGAVRTTVVSQQFACDGLSESVTIAAASGSYDGAPASRNNVVELVTDGRQAKAVTLNDKELAQQTSRTAFDAASSGWFNAGNNLVLAKSGSINVADSKAFSFTLESSLIVVGENFVCDNGTTVRGQSVYVVGSIDRLGNWNPAKAVKLDPTAYPRWTGGIDDMPPNTKFEWKCIKRAESCGDPCQADQWEPDPNNVATTPDSGTGSSSGNFLQ